MHWRRASGILILALGVAGVALAADRPTLADAAERRDQVLVRTLLDAKTDVNAAQADGTTALHWAAYNDDLEMVTLLVRSGANVNASNRYGVPPLSLACANGNAAVATVLLEAGADANAALKGGETVLMAAARAGNPAAVQALLAHHARLDARERRGQTALMWAAAEGHAAVVQTLIDAGADVFATLESGFTPFFFAVREGHIDVVRALVDAGVDVNATVQRAETGRPIKYTYKPAARDTSALLLAVQNGHFELAIALVDLGADPNDRRSGFTPLHTLTWVRKPDSSDGSEPAPIGSGRLTSLEFVREIVKRGADVNLRLPKGTPKVPNTSSRIDAEGATPFLFAADRSDVPLMQLLVELGADPLLPNFTGSTPLMAAAGLGTTEPLEEAGEEIEALEAVNILLDLGADIDAVDDNGDTAMHGAAYNSYPLVVQLLADRGADPQVWKERNKFGRTPLFIAEGYHGRLPRPDPPT
ncbi:MAG TPA: ankyrin repeat domain-containing protein, partial [Vicinamibacterales bacterium]|nr:ankyrin repeat domain-containing protein [Vicinamibacterales bacterium]